MLYLLNSLITPFRDAEATFKIKKISAAEARRILQGRSFTSAVGHEATAQALSVLLGTSITVNRTQVYFAPGDEGLAFVLRARLPEGTVLKTVEEIEKIGYELYHIVRVE